jgi:hypothetical protein
MAGHNWLFVLRIKRSKQGKAKQQEFIIYKRAASKGRKQNEKEGTVPCMRI